MEGAGGSLTGMILTKSLDLLGIGCISTLRAFLSTMIPKDSSPEVINDSDIIVFYGIVPKHEIFLSHYGWRLCSQLHHEISCPSNMSSNPPGIMSKWLGHKRRRARKTSPTWSL